MGRMIFPSLERSDHWAYCYDSARDYSSSTVFAHFAMFETYGHGMTAHSPDYPVPLEYLTDYLYSMADAMRHDPIEQLPENEAEIKVYPLRWEFENAARLRKLVGSDLTYCRPDDDLVAFCHSLRPRKDGKRSWYSLEDRKVSMSEAKRHDRRYKEVPDWADGGPDAIHRMLWRDWYTGFYTYVSMYWILYWYQRVEKTYMGTAVSYLKPRDNPLSDWHKVDGSELDSAYRLCCEIIHAYDTLRWTGQHLKQQKERIAEKKAEKEVA